MGYTHTLWSALDAALGARVTDPSGIFYTQAERKLALTEALRVWNALTGFWRARGTLATAAGVAFYDLPSSLRDGSNAYLRPYTVTDRQLLTEMCYYLIEKQPTGNPLAWAGTGMFTLADLVQALQRRRNQFLVDTGAVITASTQNVTLPNTTGRIALADTVIDVRRMAWLDASSHYLNLWASDEYGETGFNDAWMTADAPEAYSIAAASPLIAQLLPRPALASSIHLLTVNTGADLNPNTPVVMGVPDDFAWAVKWGALADVLNKDGEAQDPLRAKYCEDRYQQGVEAAKLSASVIAALIGTQPLLVSSLAELDTYSPDWQSGVGVAGLRKAPDTLALAGLNLLAASLVPDGVYTLTLDVVQNAPIPVLDADYVQVGREDLDAILDYAAHVLMFKEAGGEFFATQPLLAKFAKQASVYNARLTASAPFMELMGLSARREEQERPRMEQS